MSPATCIQSTLLRWTRSSRCGGRCPAEFVLQSGFESECELMARSSSLLSVVWCSWLAGRCGWLPLTRIPGKLLNVPCSHAKPEPSYSDKCGILHVPLVRTCSGDHKKGQQEHDKGFRQCLLCSKKEMPLICRRGG